MTQPETTDATLSTEVETPEAEPAPEPWTEERVTAWNAYYDLYVAAGVLLLVFIVSATKISNSSLWPLLQAGRLTLSQGWPIEKDAFSYTEADRPWVNIPWVFEGVNSLIYRSLAPDSLDRRPGQVVPADQWASGALIAISAVLRVLTALVLLQIRRPGPGLWWTALCVAMAFGGVLGPPSGFALGGIAGQATVTPDTWGLFLLAIELLLLHKALNLGRPGALYGLIPLFLVWANLDESFVTGLIVLGAAVLGLVQKPSRTETRVLSLPRGLAIWAGCAIACLVNPSFYHVYEAALTPLFQVFASSQDSVTIDQVSVFGPSIRQALPMLYRWFVADYLILVGLGLGSFYMNRLRFSLSRFLMYLAVSVMWGIAHRYRAEFAAVFAATMSLNGQEYFLDRYGAKGRLGRGWALWSIGGRAISIVLICLFMVKGLTGYGGDASTPEFGFGMNPDVFSFEAADTLRSAKINGNVLNTSAAQGDALIWRAYPTRKTFIDSRPHAFPPALRSRFDEIRRALRSDEIEKWRPLLDEHNITAVMLDVAGSPITYDQLRRSPNWIRFYDDGNVVMFGRRDAKDPDITYFMENQLDADTLVYQRRRPVESTQSPPRLITSFDRYYDSVFQSRVRAPSQPHVMAANRWLEPGPGSPFPDPAHCLMAVWHARTALARRPDDPAAFRILVDAYKILMMHESAILQGRTLSAANFEQITIQPRVLNLRFDQRVTALNYAIQTTPTPTDNRTPSSLLMEIASPDEVSARVRNALQARSTLQAMNGELAELYLSMDMLDLARDRLQKILDITPAAEISPDFRTQMTRLNEQMDEVRTRLRALPEAEQADPVQVARRALSMGATGRAIEELYDAEQKAVRQVVVRPMLVDLYCQTGQPDRALDILGTDTEDPSLNTGPGTAARRQGLVNFLIGNNEYAGLLWQDRAVPQLRKSQIRMAITSTQGFLAGEVRNAADAYLELPDLVANQAGWEFDLALCLLESGEPTRAAEHFTNALVLVPNLPTRPVIAYYLEKLGQPVPPRSNAAAVEPAAPKAP